MMREQLIKYIEFLFKDAPEKEDLKNEIMSNTLDKFDDLVSGGMSEETAFNCAVSGIGDISSLIGKGDTAHPAQKPRAFMLALAVALYILSLLPVIIFENNDRLGPSLMFVMIAIATAIIIYRATAFKKYEAKAAEKEIKPEDNEKNIIKNSIQSAVWALCIVIYFVVSFSTGAWHVTWVIFIIGAALSNIVNAAFSLGK